MHKLENVSFQMQQANNAEIRKYKISNAAGK